MISIDNKPVIIRASSLSGYADCPRRTACKSWSNIITDAGYPLRKLTNGIGAAVGTATHAGAAYSLTAKMADGTLGNKTEADQRTLQALDDEVVDGVQYDATTSDMNTAQGQSLRQVAAYRSLVAPAITPIEVELRLEAEIAPGWVLSGQPDVREATRIRDTKTGAKMSFHGSQIGAYALLVKSQPNAINVTEVAVDFIQRSTLKKPQHNPVTEIYDPREAERQAWAVIRRAMADMDAFRAGGDDPISAFLPNSMSMLCSSKYCPAFGTETCRAHRAAKED